MGADEQLAAAVARIVALEARVALMATEVRTRRVVVVDEAGADRATLEATDDWVRLQLEGKDPERYQRATVMINDEYSGDESSLLVELVAGDEALARMEVVAEHAGCAYGIVEAADLKAGATRAHVRSQLHGAALKVGEL